MKFLKRISLRTRTWIRTNAMPSWNTNTIPDALPITFIPAVAYRVNGWPSLRDDFKTASNYRVLSTMYVEAVTWDWLVGSLGGSLSQTAALLKHLEALGTLQIVKVHYELSKRTLSECIDEHIKAHNARVRPGSEQISLVD